ncbi:hypothetical protein [Pseudomonas sp. TWR1-1-3]|uniref:hypothetical protein n=1 Tax=Pseudomonas sp. TWR1-1-3 TaxID=2804624 RepID=UPI003CF331BD
MTNAVTQQQLDHTLRLFEKLENNEITIEVLKEAVNNHAAQILSKQHLINFTFTALVTGRFIVRQTGLSPLTPFGRQRLADIKAA